MLRNFKSEIMGESHLNSRDGIGIIYWEEHYISLEL